jgi:hypothetical protein
MEGDYRIQRFNKDDPPTLGTKSQVEGFGVQGEDLVRAGCGPWRGR